MNNRKDDQANRGPQRNQAGPAPNQRNAAYVEHHLFISLSDLIRLGEHQAAAGGSPNNIVIPHIDFPLRISILDPEGGEPRLVWVSSSVMSDEPEEPERQQEQTAAQDKDATASAKDSNKRKQEETNLNAFENGPETSGEPEIKKKKKQQSDYKGVKLYANGARKVNRSTNTGAGNAANESRVCLRKPTTCRSAARAAMHRALPTRSRPKSASKRASERSARLTNSEPAGPPVINLAVHSGRSTNSVKIVTIKCPLCPSNTPGGPSFSSTIPSTSMRSNLSAVSSTNDNLVVNPPRNARRGLGICNDFMRRALPLSMNNIFEDLPIIRPVRNLFSQLNYVPIGYFPHALNGIINNGAYGAYPRFVLPYMLRNSMAMRPQFHRQTEFMQRTVPVSLQIPQYQRYPIRQRFVDPTLYLQPNAGQNRPAGIVPINPGISQQNEAPNPAPVEQNNADLNEQRENQADPDSNLN